MFKINHQYTRVFERGNFQEDNFSTHIIMQVKPQQLLIKGDNWMFQQLCLFQSKTSKLRKQNMTMSRSLENCKHFLLWSFVYKKSPTYLELWSFVYKKSPTYKGLKGAVCTGNLLPSLSIFYRKQSFVAVSLIFYFGFVKQDQS